MNLLVTLVIIKERSVVGVSARSLGKSGCDFPPVLTPWNEQKQVSGTRTRSRAAPPRPPGAPAAAAWRRFLVSTEHITQDASGCKRLPPSSSRLRGQGVGRGVLGSHGGGAQGRGHKTRKATIRKAKVSLVLGTSGAESNLSTGPPCPPCPGLGHPLSCLCVGASPCWGFHTLGWAPSSPYFRSDSPSSPPFEGGPRPRFKYQTYSFLGVHPQANDFTSLLQGIVFVRWRQ